MSEFTDYASLSATNWSRLKHLRESPLKYQHMLNAPDEDTSYFAMGRATHSLVFEPHVFERDFVIWEGAVRRGKVWDEFEHTHRRHTILKASEADQCQAMANAVKVHPLVAPYLKNGLFEQSVTWTDPASGEPCKARVDWISDGRALLDLKTTTTIDAFRFGRIAARLGYHCQMAHYYNGLTHGRGLTIEEVLIVAVENNAPYDVAVFVVDDQALYAGQEEVAALIAKLQDHRAEGVWPGRYTEKTALVLPPWIYGDEDEDGDMGLKFGAKEE